MAGTLMLQAAQQDLPDDTRLPELREELRIDRSAPLLDGAPSWSIFDPVRHAYFQIGQVELALLSAWRGGTVGRVKQLFAQAQGAEPEAGLVKALLQFLLANSLVRAPLGDSVRSLGAQAKAQQQHWWTWLLHHYLFVRIPLVQPDRFLRRTVHWVAPLFTRGFVALAAVLGLAGLYFASRQWDEFIHTFPYFFSPQGLLVYGLSLAFTKTLHELGHAYAATRYGCRVPTMGVSFLVLVPVLYTDTTDTWKLRSRRQRLLVDGAGVITELCLASIATFLWAFLPAGPLRSAAFVIGTTSWVSTLAINLSPFMRFDGYYFLSDMLGVPNLAARAQAFGQWKLREWLFGLRAPMPEPASQRTARRFAFFAWATWVYRFFLFLGIALLVYHFFFKAAGIFLFAVEICWFIVLPVWRELRQWWTLRGAITRRPRGLMTLGLLGLLLIAAFLPLDRSVKVPAVLGAAREEPVFAPEAAQVAQLHVRPGQYVRQGQALFTLHSPTLEQEERETRIRLALLQARLARAVADKIDRAQTQELLRGAVAEQEKRTGLARRRALLEVKAPFDGTAADVDADLHAGQWITGKQLLTRIVDTRGVEDLRGYVEGQDAWRVRAGAEGRFVPDDPRLPSLKVALADLSAVAAEEIELAYLQSVNGGPIAVNVTDKGKAVPDQSQYPLRLQPVAAQPDGLHARQVMRGMVTLDAAGESLAAKATQQVLRVLARESGL
ncbi:HlyD family efflux transporter periplasmic adaptor subunit [Variovorax sp. KK3]|uniref:HlyD family efflux transporter periplasmic adaptor subunit n=1 Tax=Variovorax sp. KK3 TaxID=1855728 RepID=UPI0009FAA3C3|nr:site-2 protease family protein [Variovorax sp. KK3]